MKTKRLILFFGLFHLLYQANGQNLVLNWSFESYNTCPDVWPSITSCNNWSNPNTSSPDYWNACAPVSSGYSVPNTALGYQNAKDSVAFSGMFCFKTAFPNSREYITGVLVNPLNTGTKYYVSFYANQPEFMGYSIKTLGAYFTSSLPSVSNYNYWPVTPQIENKGNVISDTMNWVMVADTFTAVGGEQFITIGNFQPDSLSDTVRTYPANYAAAYYFIDAVTVIPLSEIGINEMKNLNRDILVYPNPTEGILNFEIKEKIKENASLEIVDLEGKSLRKFLIPEGSKSYSISLPELKAGIYFYRIRCENVFYKTGKIILTIEN